MPLNAPLAGPGGTRSFLPRYQADPGPKPPSHPLVSLPRHACTRRLSQQSAGFRTLVGNGRSLQSATHAPALLSTERAGKWARPRTRPAEIDLR